MTKIWLAFAIFYIGNISANIEVYDSNDVIETVIPDKPLEIGGVIPAAGLKGVVVPVEPITACQGVKSPPKDPKYKDFKMIALALKGNCTFVEKVRKVQAAGYDAAIIYNNLIQEPDTLEAKIEADVTIPSIFIGAFWGQYLKDTALYDDGFYVIVNNTPGDSIKEAIRV